jgi:hypothetical protein
VSGVTVAVAGAVGTVAAVWTADTVAAVWTADTVAAVWTADTVAVAGVAGTVGAGDAAEADGDRRRTAGGRYRCLDASVVEGRAGDRGVTFRLLRRGTKIFSRTADGIER